MMIKYSLSPSLPPSLPPSLSLSPRLSLPPTSLTLADSSLFNVRVRIAPAMFQTCSGYNIPQKGCSGTEMLNVTIGESVDFNIVLVHGNESERCNDQFIQMISLFKNDGPSRITLTDCPNSACSHNVSLMNRLNVWRTQNEFDIIVTLKKLTAADNGSYSAVADIRRPPNSTRVCMYKNFTLNVLESKS